ncbi:MAG: MerR family transcriptional regulator [Lachnospiraceae bacterium]|nr:MerR family transcriptional regulator [Lachnospiraceae bacterium]
MKTVQEVSKLAGISIRTLHHYDAIGLLSPTTTTEAGYRLYDEDALERLQCILIFRELEFPLKDIKEILDSPNFERNKALEQQIRLLTMKKEHLENLIDLARGIQAIGVKKLMDFEAFDTKKIDEYAKQAKESYGSTPAYKEFEEKSKGRTREQEKAISVGMMNLFSDIGKLLTLEPSDDAVQAKVAELRAYITEHFYNCTPEIFCSLAEMYAGGGSMTENINNYAGAGTAEFTAQAVRIYCEHFYQARLQIH